MRVASYAYLLFKVILVNENNRGFNFKMKLLPRVAELAKTWKQTSQVNIELPRWHLPCLDKSSEEEKALPQT